MAYSEYKFGDFARIYNSGPSDGLVGFAEGFAKGFVPAYTQAVKDRRDQEDELFRLQVQERTAQEERVRTRNAGIAEDRAKAQALAAALGMPELAGQIYGSLRSGLSDTVVERTYRAAIDEGRLVMPTQATPAAAPVVGTPTDPTVPDAISDPAPGDTSSIDSQMIDSGLSGEPVVTMSSQGEADYSDVREDGSFDIADNSPNWFMNVGDRLRRNRTELIQRNVDRRMRAWEEATGRSSPSADPTTAEGLTTASTAASETPITTFDMEAQDGATAGEIQATFAILPPSAALPPISELTSEERMNAALAALGDRTDPVAQQYRERLEALRRNNVEMPSFAGKSPAEINEMIETAPEKYGFMGEEWMNNFTTRAIAARDAVENFPSISGSLEERLGLQRDIAAGRYPNFPSDLLVVLNTSVERDQRLARIEPLLNSETMIGASLTDLQARRDIAVAEGAEPGELAVLDHAIAMAQERERNGEFRTYAQNVDTVREAENALSLARAEEASEATIEGLESLRRTLEAREAQEAARNSGVAAGTPVEHVITDADGTKRVGLVTIDPETGQTVDAEGNPVTSRPMTENELDQFMSIPTEVQKIGEELRQAGNGLQEALRTANTIVEIAMADPATIGLEGDLAQVITGTVRGAGSVISITNQLFTNNAVRGRDENGDQVTYVTSGQVDAELRRQGVLSEGQSIMSMTGQQLLDTFVSADITDTATRTTMLESAMIALAFRVGRIEGQSGNAMSNKDFERIMEMITGSNGDIRAFLGNLHEFMSQKVASYDDAAISFERDTSTINSFRNIYGYSPIGPVNSFEQIVASRGEERLTQAYNFFTSPLPGELAVGGGAGASTPAAPADAGSAFESFMNNPGEQDRIRGNVTRLQENNPGQIQRYIEAEAARLGIDADQLNRMLQGGQN